jgi:DNA mismatch endonuclease (patch repair protein)
MDVVDAVTRSRMMAGIKSKNTNPEMIVRKYIHAQGFRYRLHSRNLSGSPDIVLPRHRVAIFIHGCFWHRHDSCRYSTTPASNVERWTVKFNANKARDVTNTEKLRSEGWKVIVVWECELRKKPLQRLQKLVLEIRGDLNSGDVANI